MGGPGPPPENDPTSPLWQTQSRIQELEQDLASLQSQMQQLENPERHSGPRAGLEEVKQPAGGACEAPAADSAAAGGGAGGREPEPALPRAPGSPKRATQGAAREPLQNGLVLDAGERGPCDGTVMPGASPGKGM
nr:paralemmin-3-like [Pelodiscus sinensis]|eukprot:XP_014424352.1 paralemmin-3-like [Pelodiscus sinensis]